MKFRLSLMAVLFVVITATSVCAVDVIPEMRECMRSHGSQAEYLPVISKYADPGIVRQAMGLLILREPYVTKAEERDGTVCYTVEGITVGTSSELPSDIVQVYEACWKDGRVVGLKFYGAKKTRSDDVIPEMRECMRSHTTPEAYRKVIGKYAGPGVIRQAMGLLVIKNPYIVQTEKKDGAVCYTVEGVTVGTSSEIPSDIVQVYEVCWQNGRIVSYKVLGPKKVK